MKAINTLRKLANQLSFKPKSFLPSSLSEESKPQSMAYLKGKYDKYSIEESIYVHSELSNNRTKERKAFNTTDTETIDIYNKIKLTNPWLESLGIYPTSSEIGKSGSKVIKISDISDAPEDYKEKISLAKLNEEVSNFFIGGPSAESAAVLSSRLKQNQTSHIKFRVGRINESNVAHSSSQHHRRHASAINVDSNRSGHAMLPLFINRFIVPPSVTEILESDYTKIDLFLHNIKLGNIPIYIGNEIHWAKNKIYYHIGKQTDHNINVLMATDDKAIADSIYESTGIPILSAHQSDSNVGIHIVTKEVELQSLEREHKELFANTNVRFIQLNEEEMQNLFGNERHNIKAAFRYEGDCMALYNAFDNYKRIAQDHGVDWQENREVHRIFTEKDENGTVRLAGLEFRNLDTGEMAFESAKKAYLSLGYTNTYEYERKQSSSLKGSFVRMVDKTYSLIPPNYGKPVPMHDVATGVSVNAIFEVDENMRSILEKNNGRYMETSVSNSHWTLIALDADKKHALMRMTAGGNMASEQYSDAYFLNLMGNTRRLYGDKLVGVVSTYGCPRSINEKNSGEFIKICEGLVASYGHGGTGITKKNVTAAIALSILGFSEEMSALHKDCPYLFSNYNINDVVKDYSKLTNRRMGYEDSFYSSEKMNLVTGFAIFCGMLGAISLLKDKKEEISHTESKHTDKLNRNSSENIR